MGTPERGSSNTSFNFNKLINSKLSCNFCEERIDFLKFSKSSSRSHLLHECKKVPLSSPVPKSSKFRSKRVFNRLFKIQDAFEPDGKKRKISLD